jgi:hypothetical protein
MMNAFSIRTGVVLGSALAFGALPVWAQGTVQLPPRTSVHVVEKRPANVQRARIPVATNPNLHSAGGPPPGGPFNMSLVISLDGMHWALNDTLHYQRSKNDPPPPSKWYLHWSPTIPTDQLWDPPAAVYYDVVYVDVNNREAYNDSRCSALINQSSQMFQGTATTSEWQTTTGRYVYPFSDYTCRYEVRVDTRQGHQQVPLYTNAVTLTVIK